MKKPTAPIQVPDRYTDIKLIKPKHLQRKIIIDAEGKFHSYENKSSEIDPSISVDHTFVNFDEFDLFNRQTKLAYHEQFFKCEPPKKQPLTTTALMCWMYMLSEAAPHIEGTNPATGEKERKSSISSRLYSRGAEHGKPHAIQTYQAITCLRIFTETLKDRESLTEAELQKAIVDRASEIKTKQDPWRIFQYYRPKLIAAKLIKHD